MKQRELNLEIAALLHDIVHELRRSTKSEDWHDMAGLQRRISELAANVRAHGEVETSGTNTDEQTR